MTPPLSEKNKKLRVQFAQTHMKDEMNFAVFDDESKFQTYGNFKKTYHLKNEQKKKQFKVKNALKINTWIAIAYNNKFKTYSFKENMTAEKYSSICKTELIPLVKKVFKTKKLNLYHNNDPKHQSKVVLKILKDHRINRIDDWPSYSPDLNPLENIWAIIKAQVKRKNPKIERALKLEIQRAWKVVGQQTIDKAILS